MTEPKKDTKKRFLITDTHFGHRNIIKFTNQYGVVGRPRERFSNYDVVPFESAEEHDETLIANWNEVVEDHDVVYHLGDIAIARRGLKVLERLKGRKRLAGGNHDPWKMSDLTPHFEEIKGVYVHYFTKPDGERVRFIFSHFPVNDEAKFTYHLCVHGHTHSNNVLCPQTGMEDPWYWNACPEIRGNYPIPLTEIENYYLLHEEQITQSREMTKRRLERVRDPKNISTLL